MKTQFFALAASLAVAACAPAPNLTPGLQATAATAVQSGISAQRLKFTIFTPGKTPGFLAGAKPWDLAVGPSGQMWFTDRATPAVGRISTDGTVKEFRAGLPRGSRGSSPFSIVAGPDGNMWFSDCVAGAIGRITPTGAITEFSDGIVRRGTPMGIAVGSDNAIWSVELGTSSDATSFLIRVTTDGRISHFSLPSLLADGSLVAAPGGELWFLAVKNDAVLLVERKADGSLIEHGTGLHPGAFPVSQIVAAKHLILGTRGELWFTTEHFGPNNPKVPPWPLARFSDSRVALFPLLVRSPVGIWPTGIAGDGNDLWVGGEDAPFGPEGALFRVKRDGGFASYLVPFNPLGVAWNAGTGTVWFTSYSVAPNWIVEGTPVSTH
jgi:streptogramin lyase